MITNELENKCSLNNLKGHGPSPIPQEGEFTKAFDIKDISGLSHGIGGCAPQQGACKITLNVKKGIIKEALVEVIGCSGMTQSAAMAGEILPGKTLIEALNTDLVCDAINVAMKNVCLQLLYGRSQSAFSLNGLPVGSTLEDLGKYKSSLIGTIYSNEEKGTRYLNTADGYITKLALDDNNQIIGYQYINTSRLMQEIDNGINPNNAYNNCLKKYGRFDEAVKIINPRKE